MKFEITLSLLAALPLSTFALPAASSSDAFELIARSALQKRGANPIIGISDGVNGAQRPVRQELRSFVNNADQLNLFLLALVAMGKLPNTDPNSYFAIAGIHGRPYINWNGEAATGNKNTGYCTHSSILFPTWHRPYLALYEQAIYAQMKTIAGQFPSAQLTRWKNALNGFRLPYWDWATNNAQMPSILTQATWQVTQTNGAAQTINNPMYSYTFLNLPSQAQFPDRPFYQWKNTLRYPTSQTSTATSQNTKVQQQLANNAQSQKQRVYNLLMSNTYNNYAAISNKASNVGAPDSLESVHDTIHGLTGNGGHMGYVDYSAFDPIFFMHHANIDRLFALWQAVWPNAWVGSQTNDFGTYGVPAGTVETKNTPLTPFRNAAGKLFTSDDVRSTAAFGYSYPEIPDWNYQGNPAGLTTYVKQQVSKLYGSTTQTVQAHNNKRDTGNTTQQALDDSVNNSKYYDWRVDIHTNNKVLGGSYFVHVFLGQPNTDSASWSSQKELVGDYVVFKNKAAKPDNSTVCGVVENQVSGSVFLTQSLINKVAQIGSLNPEDVVPYVKENIQWRISLMDDNSVPTTEVCDLKISVSASEVTLPPPGSTTEFPKYGPYVPYGEITKGKVGGGRPSVQKAIA